MSASTRHTYAVEVPELCRDALFLLRCPVCGDSMTRGDSGPVRCAAGHSVDPARQGHLNLLGGEGARGLVADSAAMVAARDRVQSAGVFSAVADALIVNARAAALPDGGLVDLGGGTGYYAAQLLEGLSGRVAASLDLSAYAARRAASAHPRLLSVVADVWRDLPVADACTAVVLCVFAPRNPAEIARILAPGGVLLVVTPRPGHLRELITSAGMLAVDADKDRRLADQLSRFQLVAESSVTGTHELTPEQAADIVLMGPSAFHVDEGELRARLGAHAGVTVTVDVRLGVYQRGRPA